MPDSISISPAPITNSGSKRFPLLRWNQFHWAALLVCSVIAIRPVIIFLNSNDEFSLSLRDVANFSGVLFAETFIPLGVMGLFLNAGRFSRLGKILAGITLAVAVLLWVQGNFFLWDYGKLDGKPLNFGGYTVHGVCEAVLWISMVTIGAFKYEVFSRWAMKLSFVVLGSLFLSITLAYIDKPADPWHKAYQVTYDKFYAYSNQKNVIVLVIDAARSDIFEKMIPELNEQERAIFNGVTFFRNTTGTFNATNPAVTGILTGRLYDFKKTKDKAYPELFYSPTSLPYQLKQSGFVTEIYPYNNGSVFISPDIVDNLVDNQSGRSYALQSKYEKEYEKLSLVTRFNFSPHFVKKLFFDSSGMYATAGYTDTESRPAEDAPVGGDEGGLPERLKEHLKHNRSIIEKLGSQLSYRNEPVFKYLHFHGAHPPFIHDEHYEGQVLPFTIESYKKQFRGSLLMTAKALIDSLKKQGVYDKTMLIVVGDHGMFIPQPEASLQKDKAERQIVDMLTPLLMIKPFGDSSSPIRISSAPVSLFDVPATVFDALGMKMPEGGRSVYSVREDEQRPRFAYPLKGPSRKKIGSEGEKGGAFEYEINGDAQNPASWKTTYQFLRLHQGKTNMDPVEYQTKRDELSEHLDNPERYHIREWRKK